MKKLKSYRFGINAEKIVMIFLWIKGYKILHSRYRSIFGEIDIIAKKSNSIIFVEVKARKGEFNLEGVISRNQINRIKSSAQYFLSNNPNLQNCYCRFDFISVKNFFRIKHYKNFID